MYNTKNQITDTVVVLVQDSATESNYFDMQVRVLGYEERYYIRFNIGIGRHMF